MPDEAVWALMTIDFSFDLESFEGRVVIYPVIIKRPLIIKFLMAHVTLFLPIRLILSLSSLSLFPLLRVLHPRVLVQVLGLCE